MLFVIDNVLTAGTVTLKRMRDGIEVRDVTPQSALDWISADYERHRGDIAEGHGGGAGDA